MFSALIRTKAFIHFVTLVSFLLGATGATPKGMPYDQIATRILATYQQAMPKLPLEQQKHFCLRMYRLTGDTAWLPPVISDLRNVIATLQSDRDSLSNTGYYTRRIDSLSADFERETRKNRSRRALFEDNDDIRLQLDWLYKLSTIDDYHIADSTVSRLCQVTKERIQVDPLVVFLLDTQTITVYAAQAANAVEYMFQLGLGDIRNDFRRRLLEVMPDSIDGALDDNQFADKVYGLTHIVISASGYYQHTLDRSNYALVLDYFALNQERILKRLSADIIAEIGLCFLLCDDTENPLVGRCREKVTERFERKAGLIRSPLGNADLVSGEHRNILAYMVLTWTARLHPGPDLSSLEFGLILRNH